jgi:hypothetical protein
MTTAIEAIARAVGRDTASELQEATTLFARAQLELRGIRKVRHELLADLECGKLKPQELRRVAALDRYERLARTKSRRAKRSIAN